MVMNFKINPTQGLFGSLGVEGRALEKEKE